MCLDFLLELVLEIMNKIIKKYIFLFIIKFKFNNMKIYDFSKHNLNDLPLISENNLFEYVLNYNNISEINNIPFSCEKLSINNNKINKINFNQFDNKNLQLKFFDVSFNKLISLNGFNNFINLCELNLSNNFLNDDELKNLSKLNLLKNLNLSNNNLKSNEICKLISNLNSIEKINLNNNNIEYLNFNNKCENLLQLEIDNNKINKIIFNKESLINLIYLSLNSNKISEINSINNLFNLEYFSIIENELIQLNINNLNNLKLLQAKNNLLNNFLLSNNLKLIQYIEISYNNLISFKIEGEHKFLKNLIVDNNKLNNIEINNNFFFENIEFIDLSNNNFNSIDFIKFFNNVQRINLSFNNLNNLNEIISIFKQFKFLKELNLIDNNFNKNYYNINVVPNEIFNNLNDYFSNINVKNLNQKEIINYRNFIIFNINNLAYLDMIGINEEEKNNAINNNNLNNFNYKTLINNSEKNNNNINNNNLKENDSINNNSSLNFNFKNVYQKNKIFNNNNNNLINFNNNNNNLLLEKFNNSINSKNFSISLNSSLNKNDNNSNYENNNNNNYIYINYDSSNKENIIDENEKNNIYKLLKQTLINICDNNGFIIYNDFYNLFLELNNIYQIQTYFKDINKDIKNLIKNSLLPNKFHIRDLSKILKLNKYDKMYLQIFKMLKENPNIISKSLQISQAINNNIDNNNNNNNNDKLKIIFQNNNNNININTNSIQNNNIKNNNEYELLNNRILKTPLLTENHINNIKNIKINNDNNNNFDDDEENILINKKKCFNFLYQSNSELQEKIDINNISFMMNFLYFINHVDFPIKYSEINQTFLISISNEEKEYKFIKSFISNFNITQFELNKWYCYEYYSQVFNNIDYAEFLFENKILFFYSYYNEIVDNFFNDIYQIKEEFLMIEENPCNLIDKKLNINKIVMYTLIQKKCFMNFNNENELIDNIVYNQNDDKFYFKNPFDWIGSLSNNYNTKNINNSNEKKSNINILVPIYVIDIYNNDEE